VSARVPLVIGEIFRRNAEVVPERAAASLGSETLSHRALDRAGNRVGWKLRELGVRHGDRVVSWADTSLEVLPLFVALARIGAVFAPLGARLGPEEAAEVSRLARPRLLVTDTGRGALGAEVARALGSDHASLGRLDGDDPRALLARAGRDDEVRCPELRESDPHVIFFTSGSTGRPKGVVLSHRANWLRSFQGVFRDEPERTVCMFPLFHMAAFTLALAAWQTRGEIALVAEASAEAILDAAARRRANRLYCIPAVWHRILETEPARFDVSSLREIDTGTSATPIELIRALKERFPGTVTRVYYGSTEAGSVATLADVDVLRKPGSVGPPSPGVDLRLGTDGELLVRSAYLMDGYFDDPEATATALRDGWLHTGDLGVVDDEGYLSIVGRLGEVIRTGGESVSPGEVEAVLALHPGVSDVTVVGVPDVQWGAIVCAVVVAASGASLTLADLQKHCDGRLAPFKRPRRLDLVDALPRTPATGQVQRALLVQRLLSQRMPRG
jgi:acyl-CoA synthetase (AMP-forming)/AMP-acid ligase II